MRRRELFDGRGGWWAIGEEQGGPCSRIRRTHFEALKTFHRVGSLRETLEKLKVVRTSEGKGIEPYQGAYAATKKIRLIKLIAPSFKKKKKREEILFIFLPII